MIHKQYNTAMQGRVENTDNKNAQNAQKKGTKMKIKWDYYDYLPIVERMYEQLKHLENEINSITLDNIKDNNDPKTIKNQFNIISDNIKDIRNGKKPY